MQPSSFKIYIAVLVAMVIWGFSYVWSKQVFEFYSPITTIFSRLFFSSLFLWIYLFLAKKFQKIERKDYFTFFLTAFLQPFVYFLGENYGLQAIPNTTITSVIIATIPLFTPIAAYFSLNEKLTLKKTLGIVVSFVGVIFVVTNNQFDIQAPAYGLALLFLAVFAAVVNGVLLEKLSSKYNVVMMITVQNTIGFSMFAVLFVLFDFNSVMQIGLKTQAILPILMLAFFASSVAYLFFTYGIQKMGITRTNVFANILPIFTAISAFVVFGEKLTLLNIAGMLLVITGLIISQRKIKSNLNFPPN